MHGLMHGGARLNLIPLNAKVSNTLFDARIHMIHPEFNSHLTGLFHYSRKVHTRVRHMLAFNAALSASTF